MSDDSRWEVDDSLYKTDMDAYLKTPFAVIRYWSMFKHADCIRDADFITELVHYIGELQGELMEKQGELDFLNVFMRPIETLWDNEEDSAYDDD